MNKKYAVFTMDVEAFTDTECVSYSGADIEVDLLDGFDEYIKILDKYGIKSTLFTVGKLAPKIAGKMKRCVSAGHRVALHSYEHIAPMDLSLEKFREQTKKAREMLCELFGTEVVGFRAPCFSIDKARLDILRELGFSYDSSHLDFPARHTVELDLSSFSKLRDGIFHKDGFYEFGLSRSKVFGHRFPISGGGYVRLSNWSFIKSLIHQHLKQSNYYVFYLHPFELTHQRVPFIKELNLADKYYLKAGIATYRYKIESIIKMLKKSGYEFVTFEDLVGIMNEQR